jgi:hypothetical protein
VRWLQSNPVLVIGLLLIAAQLGWKASLLGSSFFRLDDYYYLERASTTGLTWHYLLWVNAGHLNVVGAAIAWVVVRISPYNWTLACGVTLVLLGGTCVALLRMLQALFGDRPGILVLLLLYLLSPLSFPGLSWWTVTLEQLPLQLGIFCAVAAHVRFLRTRRYRHAAVSAAWMALAMLSGLQGAAVPLLLFAMTWAFFTRGTPARAVWTALRDHWRAWILYAALIAAYLPLYIIRLGLSSVTAQQVTLADALTAAGTLLRKAFVTGVFGGPWRWAFSGATALANPPSVLIGVSAVLAILVVLASLMYAWQSWRAWALLAGWLLIADIAPAAAGQSSLASGGVPGLLTMYAWDASGILVLCLGLAFLSPVDSAVATRPRRRLSRPEFAAATTMLAAVLVGSLWSFYDYPARSSVASARSYIATARLALKEAPSGTAIVDDPVPSDITGGITGSAANASSVLSPLLPGAPGGTQFVTQPEGTYDHLLEFDGFGRLVPSTVLGETSQPLPARKSCWPASDGLAAVSLNSVVTNATTLRIGYYATGSGKVIVSFGSQSLTYQVQPGLNSAYFPVTGSLELVLIQHLSGTMPCVGDIQAGSLFPSTNGTGIPPLAVSG